jgi:hypothetical protein
MVAPELFFNEVNNEDSRAGVFQSSCRVAENLAKFFRFVQEKEL